MERGCRGGSHAVGHRKARVETAAGPGGAFRPRGKLRPQAAILNLWAFCWPSERHLSALSYQDQADAGPRTVEEDEAWLVVLNLQWALLYPQD